VEAGELRRGNVIVNGQPLPGVEGRGGRVK
jgi:hypothetical protein